MIRQNKDKTPDKTSMSFRRSSKGISNGSSRGSSKGAYNGPSKGASDGPSNGSSGPCPRLSHSRKFLLLLLSLVVFLSALFIWDKTQTTTLLLGLFSGSAWDVPSPESYRIIDEAIEVFEAENPGIKVEYETGILKEDYSDWLARRVAAGRSPDVFLILPEDFDLYCSIGALKPLDNIMKQHQVDTDALYPSALQSGQYDGIQYALPFESNVDLLFVNTSLLAKEGISLPESLDLEHFYEICRQVSQDQDGNGVLDQFGICDYSWKYAADAFGVPLFNTSGTSIDLMNESFLNALDYARNINALHEDVYISGDEFSNGQAAFSAMSFADYKTYAPYPWRIKRLSNFDWDVLPMPVTTEGIGEIQSIQMAVSSHSSHSSQAWKLLETLCLNPDIQSLIYSYAQGVSPLKNARPAEDTFNEVDFSILDQVMNRPIRSNHFSLYNQALEQVDMELSKVMQKEQNLEISLMQVQEKINRFLNY